MMATDSDAEMIINATREIINNVEKYGQSLATEMQIHASLKDSLFNADKNSAVEKSVLERLAFVHDGNGSDSSEELKSNAKLTFSPGGDIIRIIEQLEQLIQSDCWISKEVTSHAKSRKPSEFSNTRGRFVISHLSELERTLVTSSSLKSYINLLGNHHRQCVASWLYDSTSQILSTIFRTPNNNLHCSDHDLSIPNSIQIGIGHAIRLALYETYGANYCSKGWRVFTEMGPPVVYISPALQIDLTSYLSTEYLIGDIVILKKSDEDFADIEGRIDHNAFAKQLDDDIAVGKKPLIVIGVVGSSIRGQNDIISRLLEIRESKAQIWIHVVGLGLSALCLKEPSEMLVQVLSKVDSFTAPLSLWLGIPAAPVITLHRSVGNYKLLYQEKLAVLPWWIVYHQLTASKITDIIENAYFLSKTMLQGLTAFPQIEIIGVENPTELANRIHKGISAPPTVLIFKYKGQNMEVVKKEKIRRSILTNDSGDANGTFVSDSSAPSDDDIDELAEHVDSLNFWLGQGLILDCRQLGLEMITFDNLHSSAFRFCPLESAASDVFSLNSIHVDHVHKFIKQLSNALAVIESTATAKKHFKEFVSKYPSLGLAPIRKWGGVGAVCYIPSIVKETPMNEWNEKQRQQVSHLNLELVHSLRCVDAAFSSGECPAYNVSCVKFGMLSDDKDLADLVHLVAERGKEIEQSQKYMDSLAEMIREGIEAANEDLKRENDARFIQEGMMRHIPLMSSLVNWFSPLEKDLRGIKGRTFDLKTGQIQSTEIYYKHLLMNGTDATSEDSQHTVMKTPSKSTKQQNDLNSNRDTIQNDVELENVKEKDSG